MPEPNVPNPRSRSSKLLAALAGKSHDQPPIWLMRQAGRYLPEYRDIRTKADGFLNLCYNPKLASEVTLQPISRFDFDAAILFSDILIVPHALGQKVWFEEGEGPRLEAITDRERLATLKPEQVDTTFSIIYETVSRVRSELAANKALIGFCGAPWTVATYMVAGRGTPDQAPARQWAYTDPEAFSQLINSIVDASVDYLSGQISAGADAIQIFDTWAGNLPEDQLQRWVIEPTAKIVTRLRERHPAIPIIGFPRGIGVNVPDYSAKTGITAIGCDTAMPLAYMRDQLGPLGLTLQGNLDPLLMLAGKIELQNRAEAILTAMRGLPFIFNLGHGIVPATSPENVAKLVEVIRSFDAG